MDAKITNARFELNLSIDLNDSEIIRIEGNMEGKETMILFLISELFYKKPEIFEVLEEAVEIHNCGKSFISETPISVEKLKSSLKNIKGITVE